jgi:hypothetical protein
MFTRLGDVGVCTRDLAQATAGLAKINVRRDGHPGIVVGVVPDTNTTLRVRTATGAIRTVPVADGVYVVPTGLRHISIKRIS